MQQPRHFLIRWAKYYGPLFLILLAVWFGHEFNEPVSAALMVIAVLGISWFFLWRPKARRVP